MQVRLHRRHPRISAVHGATEREVKKIRQEVPMTSVAQWWVEAGLAARRCHCRPCAGC